MALVFADLVQETTSTTGVGTLTLTGAVAGFQTFAAIGNANTTYYKIKSGNDSEVGLGTYTSSGTTLSRDTVLYSTAGGTTKITVASGATVICTYPAEKIVILDASGNPTSNVGFLNIPQNIQASAYTLVLADSGYHLFHASGASAATYTIPAASSVAFPLGTAISFVNMATTAVTIAITTDTMYLSGTAGTTGSRTLAQYGSATAIKVSGLSSSGVWLISGLGLT